MCKGETSEAKLLVNVSKKSIKNPDSTSYVFSKRPSNYFVMYQLAHNFVFCAFLYRYSTSYANGSGREMILVHPHDIICIIIP